MGEDGTGRTPRRDAGADARDSARGRRARRGARLAALLVALVLAAIGIDGALHASGLGAVGRWLGPLGTGLIVASFGYSMRKRDRIRVGSARAWLRLHEALALLGALALLVHGGVHLHALLPWLAVLAMLVAVASGLTGELLLGRDLSTWRVVHLPIALNFAVLAALHIVTVVVFR